jgi:hypothetical protein
LVVKESFDEWFDLIKERVIVVNDSCIIDHVHTSLHVVQCDMLTLKNLLTFYFLTPFIKIRMVFILNPYLIFHQRLVILGHE